MLRRAALKTNIYKRLVSEIGFSFSAQRPSQEHVQGGEICQTYQKLLLAMEETKGSAKKLIFSLTTSARSFLWGAKFSSDTDCLVRTERLADISTKTQQDITQPQGEGKGIHFEPQNANFRKTQVDSAVRRDMLTTTTATSNSRQRSYL